MSLPESGLTALTALDHREHHEALHARHNRVFVDIVDHGATAGADNTTAIQAAVDAAAAGSVKRVNLTVDSTVSNTITMADGVILDGLGCATLTMSTSPSGNLASRGRVLDFSNVTGAEVTGVTFVKPSSMAGYSLTSELAVVYGSGMAECTVRNNVFELTGSGLAAVFVKGSTATDNKITDNRVTGAGIQYSYAGASRTLCARNLIDSPPSNGLSGNGNSSGVYNEDCLILDNVIVSAGRMGIEDVGSGGGQTRGTIIRGNLVETSANIGISAAGIAPQVVGNEVKDATSYGIETGGDGTRVALNRVQFVSASAAVGIVVNASKAETDLGASVVGNTVYGASTAIQTIGSMYGVTVADNLLTDWTSRAVDAGGSHPVTVSGNFLRQTTQNGSGATRYGIVGGAAGSLFHGNTIIYESSVDGGAHSDIAVKFSNGSCVYVGNLTDAGSVTTPAVPSWASGGSTPSHLRIIGNVYAGGAVLNTQFLVTPLVFGNEVSGGSWSNSSTAVAATFAGGIIAGATSTSGAVDKQGSGSPEGVLSAPVGSTYRRTDGGSGTSFYVKESGTGNTGWVAK